MSVSSVYPPVGTQNTLPLIAAEDESIRANLLTFQAREVLNLPSEFLKLGDTRLFMLLHFYIHKIKTDTNTTGMAALSTLYYK